MSTLAGLVTASGDGKTLPLLGTLKASGLQTGGGFEVIEYEGPIHPPPHIHREREEAFYVLTGSFTFTLGIEEFEVGAGGFVLVPRGTRHGFIAAAGAKALLLIVPAGLERFFQELGTGLAAGKTSEEMRTALAGRYDSYPDPS